MAAFVRDRGWFLAASALPQPDQAGGFGAVEVIVQCDSMNLKTGPMQVMRLARYVFIGGDPNRILWISMDKAGEDQPIENASWYVTHWRPFPKFPKPVKRRA